MSPEAPRLRSLDEGILHCIAYRGRDAKSAWSDQQNVTFHHARLSIIDIEGGGQPMHDRSGRYTIVFNGAIYNYRELRREYESTGASFQTSSDTEVILEGFCLKGERVVHDLNGMFAFAIWDNRDRRLFIARDRLGKKPLFWVKIGTDFFFTSTLHAFRNLPGWTGAISQPGLALFGFLGGFPENETIFEQAWALPYASFGWYNTSMDAPAITRYWRPRYGKKQRAGLERQMEEYAAILGDAIRIRLRSDVPLALSFSGGTDSGTIAALAKRDLGTSLSCYTIDYDSEEEPSDEVRIAREVATLIDLPWTHIQYDYRNVILEDLADAYSYFDQPCQQFALVYSKRLYDVMKAYCTVVLTGNGADELFTGYIGNELTRQQDMRRTWLNRIPRLARGILPASIRTTWEAANLGGLPVHRWAQVNMDAHIRTMAPDPVVHDGCASVINTMTTELQECGIETVLDLAMHRNLTVSTVDSNYRLPDITGYAAQIEVRSPFLDYRMVEFAARLPHRFKVAQPFDAPRTKFLPRTYYEGIVGRNLAWEPKRGMGANLQWGLEFAKNPRFAAMMTDAYSTLESSGLVAAPFRDAYARFCNEVAAGASVRPSAGVMMNGFMLGSWLSQNGMVGRSHSLAHS